MSARKRYLGHQLPISATAANRYEAESLPASFLVHNGASINATDCLHASLLIALALIRNRRGGR